MAVLFEEPGFVDLDLYFVEVNLAADCSPYLGLYLE